jgi:uncharacterized protein (TIGR03437 family)
VLSQSIRLLAFALVLAGADPGFPDYTAASVVNPIAGVAGMFAPNSFLTIYGRNLSYVTRAMGPDDLRAGMLPTVLIGTGVRVLINHVPANIYYVSPTQVNLLLPAGLMAGPASVQLINDSLAGPAINIVLDSVAPAVFELNGIVALAAHLDGTVVSPEAPARHGEVVVLYATGLGPTVPPAPSGRLPDAAAALARLEEFQVWLNGSPVPRVNILYAGLSPPYAGLFQINLRIPDDAPTDPEIRCGFPDQMSQAGAVLPIL